MEIKIFLWKNNILLKDFAKTIGYNVSYVSLVANYRTTPSPEFCKKVEEYTKGAVKAKSMLRKALKKEMINKSKKLLSKLDS